MLTFATVMNCPFVQASPAKSCMKNSFGTQKGKADP